jgi:histidine triad (HIT) family protein
MTAAGDPGAPGAEPACVFCRIAAGRSPARIVLESERVLAFEDHRPQAPVHVLVVPRAHVASLWELDDRDLAGELLAAAAEVARRAGLERGFRVIANARRDGGQEVEHLHLHVLGGRRLGAMLARN